MALSFRLPAPTRRESIADAWLAVVARHGTLRSAFAPGADGEPLLHEIEIDGGSWVEHQVAPGQAVNDALRDVLDAACSPYRHPSHRLCVLETAAGLTVVIAADHAHVDMWSMLVIARDLLSALDAGRTGADRCPGLHPHSWSTRRRCWIGMLRRTTCVGDGKPSSRTAVVRCRSFPWPWGRPNRIANVWKCVTCSMWTTPRLSLRRPVRTASRPSHAPWSR
ncbi:hypothetical protein [Microbacterium sp.]|uniref:hypothetical protein n=1 Tax=Microbacterium sp. TaxID=51671 RepID=UPI0035685F95